MKRILAISAILFAVVSLSAQVRLSLDGEWKFRYAADIQTAERLMSDYLKDGFTKTKMDLIKVPSNWAVLGYEEPVYRGFKEDKASEGFYMKTFSVPEAMLTERLLLHFAGVWSSAEVYLNGEYVGYHQGGYTPFAFDVTEKLLAENVLMLRVRQVDRGYQFDVYDDWTLGGIYRSVEIEAMPRRRSIEKISYTVDFDPYYRDASLNVRAMIHDMHKNTLPGNYPSPGEPYALAVTLKDADGMVVSAKEISVPAHISTDREVYCTMNISSPSHWTAETPALYSLEVAIKENEGVTHRRSCNVGFREITTDGGVFRINGQPVKLRGVNRHDEYPTVGRATTREHWLKDITMMKEANINYIRCAHYTPAKGFVDLCDSLGMYLGNEVSLGGAGMLMYDPSMIDGVLQRTYETIERDLNNPCIVYWSIGNEDPLTSQHMAAVKLAKAIDPTRPVLLPWRAEEWLPEEVDILAPHYWQVHEYDSLAAVSTRPIITTEYTHAFGHDGFGSLQARWDALTSHPSGAGAAVWMWADQGILTPVKKDPKKMGISKDEYLRISEAGWDGIVDSYRNFTRDYHELKAVYAYVRPLDEKVTFSVGDTHAGIRLYNGYDFRNLNTVGISWKIFAGRQILAEGNAVSVDAVAHSVGVLPLPVSSIKEAVAGVPYYAWLTFTSADGYEICTRSVELIPETVSADLSGVKGEISESREGKMHVLTLVNCRYSFDTTKGLLMSVDRDGERILSEMRPALWHDIDRGDRSVIGKNNINKCPNLDKYTSAAESWEADVTSGKAVLKARVRHVSNDENSIEALYTYVLSSDGTLSVRYELLPKYLVPSVPVAGMKMKLAGSAAGKTGWFGAGPWSSHPNRKAAGILGYWELECDSSVKTLGIKGCRRIFCSDVIEVVADGYFESNGGCTSLAVYSDVLGRPEKGRKPLDVPQMHTNADPFIGGFIINVK